MMLDMTISEILGGGAAIAVALATLFQIAPIKINPWTSLAKAIGREINAEVILLLIVQLVSLMHVINMMRHTLRTKFL